LQWVNDCSKDERKFVDKYNYKKYTADKLGNNTGVFYLINGILGNAGLIEHGSGCRRSWLTELGSAFLAYLNSQPLEVLVEMINK
jgi:hypothetical protein